RRGDDRRAQAAVDPSCLLLGVGMRVNSALATGMALLAMAQLVVARNAPATSHAIAGLQGRSGASSVVTASSAVGPNASESPVSDTGKLREVIVTATRRAERLEDVPVAVTAVSGNMLRSTGAYSTENLTQLVPELSFQQGNHSANTAF
ncbi:hypothetical protein B2A_06404, partial [mine drainage metagenome]